MRLLVHKTFPLIFARPLADIVLAIRCSIPFKSGIDRHLSIGNLIHSHLDSALTKSKYDEYC